VRADGLYWWKMSRKRLTRRLWKGESTSDFFVDGVKTELKTIYGTSPNTPVTRIQEGFEQNAEVVILDMRGTGVTLEKVNTIIKRISGIYQDDMPGKIEIWTRFGPIIYDGVNEYNDKQAKDSVLIDLTGAKNIYDVHERISGALEFPGWYGRNLDALWDMLKRYEKTLEVRFKGTDAVFEDLAPKVKRIVETFKEAETKFGYIRVVLV